MDMQKHSFNIYDEKVSKKRKQYKILITQLWSKIYPRIYRKIIFNRKRRSNSERRPCDDELTIKTLKLRSQQQTQTHGHE